ncbi:MAG: DUF4276 family protein [Zoogloeaceae bacterium]|jgi:hypothetical protein|nr:DUF4276 family protein [Zoogloeaceae bacterium]
MAGRIVFLLEEPSMKVLLDGFLPRLFPGWVETQHFLCVKHEGKSDLDRSIPRKLKAWRYPDDIFVIVRDNDNADCIAQKERLRAMSRAAGRPDTLVRLVCQELESWYLGDLQALGKAFNMEVNTPGNKKRFANPDTWQKPSHEIRKLLPPFQKISGARAIAGHLQKEKNCSRSFQIFIQGISHLAQTFFTANNQSAMVLQNGKEPAP